MPAKIIHTTEQIQYTKELFDRGLGARQIAKELKITRWQVQSIYKILGVYNIGRTMPRTAYLATHKICADCKIDKPISEFRKLFTKKTNRTSFDCYCNSCKRKKISAKQKRKRKEDPSYKLYKNISWAIWFNLKKNKSGKNNKSCLDFLPYTMKELRDHISSLFEPWMNWENQGVYKAKTWDDNDPLTWTWQLDHIIPQSLFPYNSMEDDNFKLCWALDNLRPLSAKQNNLEGTNRIRHKNI
jgi:hypothetical protein